MRPQPGMDDLESQPGESILLKGQSSPTASLHTREHKFTPEQRTSLKGFQVIASGKRAGDQLDDYIRSRSPSATPPRSPTARKEEALLFAEANPEILPQVYSAGVPQAALDQRLGSGHYSGLQKNLDEMATREEENTRRVSDQSAPSILGQKSVDSLLTEDSNASHMSGASVRPGSLAEPGSMSLEAFRQEWENLHPGQEQDGAVEGRFSSELEKDQPRISDISLHGARPAVPQGGTGVAIGRLTTSDSLAPPATNEASPRTSLDRIAEHPPYHDQSISGGSGSTLFGPPSGRVRAESADQVAMTDSAEVPHESTLSHLTEALGFGSKEEELGWAGEKRAAASQMDQIGKSQESTPADSKSTLSRVTEAVGLEGMTEGVGLGVGMEKRVGLGVGMEKRAAAHELADLGAAHENSRDPVTGDAAEEKGLPPLTAAEQRQAAFQDGTPVTTGLAKPEPLQVSKKGFADVSKSPVSVLEGNDASRTEQVYSDKQSDIWGAVGVGAAEGAGVGVALGAAAAAAAVVAPPVTAVAAGIGAGTLVGAGAAAAFGAKTEVPTEEEPTDSKTTTTESAELKAGESAGKREIPLSEFRLEKDYPVVLPESGVPGETVPVMEADPRSEIPLSEFSLHKHYYNVLPKAAEGAASADLSFENKGLETERLGNEGRERKEHETEQVYSDKQSDIWSAVGKAAAGGVGVGAALGAATTAVVAAPAVTAVAAGVGAGGLVGAGAAAAFGAKKEVPKEPQENEAFTEQRRLAGDGTDDVSGAPASRAANGVPRPAAKDLTPSEQKAATKIAGALAANAAAATSNPDKKRDFGDVALQATAVSAWAQHPGQDAAADDEAEARRANADARARAQKQASGAAPGEPLSVTVVKMLKRPEGALFVLFAAMLAPFWLAAHIGLGSVGFFWQLVLGIFTGMAAMLLYQALTAYRSRRRLRRAMDIATLGVMDLNDLRALMNNQVPTHVSFQEFEKVGWLNKSLERMWPYINKAASKLLEETLTPILEMYKPVVLEKMKIKKLNLGTVAPIITGARIRNGEKPGQVVLDVKLDWRRGKPNLYLDVNPYLSPAITAKVRDVDILGWMRITFAPLTGKDFPCFGAVVLSLQEEPFIDFTIGIEGASIAVIPGLDSMIDNTIKTAVVDMLLWPSRMVFPILEGDYRDLEFLPTGVLTVTIIEATGLMNTDIIGKSDPFVFVYVRKLKERIKRTTTKKDDLNPVWNETFEVLVEAPDIQELTLRVMDEETMADAEFIGMAKVPLRQNKPGEVVDKWVDLVPESIIEQRRAGEKHVHERVRGRLHFRMRWDPYEKGKEPWRSDDFMKQEEAKRKQMEEEEREQMKSKGKKGKKK